MNTAGRLVRPTTVSSTSNGFVCWRCQVQARRTITQNFLKRKQEGREKWAEMAKEIRDGKRKSMLTVLEERGFVHDTAGGRSVVENLMIDKRIGVYAGIDPTAPSLHVGHMLPLMVLFWMYLYGFHSVSLLGSSTARIGDPTGRTTDRNALSSTERKANLAGMHYQLKKLWISVERVGKRYGFENDKHWRRELANNGVWWNKVPFMDVLKLMGNGIRLGPMLSRDTVKNKMASGDGMSFSEFCYPIMQAWDFWRLYDEKGLQMQVGGQDQYGNIVAGIDAVKHVAKTHPDPDLRAPSGGIKPDMMPVGLTVPLLTTSSGEKFGKSAGNAIWLEAQMTTIFDLYGFFVRTSDADVMRYLKLFTFMPLDEINSICEKHKTDPSKRVAQHKLAYEFLDLVHGEAAAKTAQKEHAAAFSKNPTLSDITSSLASRAYTDDGLAVPAYSPEKPGIAPHNPLQDHQNANKREEGSFLSSQLNRYAPQTNSVTENKAHIILPKSLIYDVPFARVLYSAGMVSSRSEGHRLTQAQGAYIGHQSGLKRKDGASTEMNDQLSFTPAKLHDKRQTWNYVIRPTESMAEADRHAASGEEGVLILRSGKWKIRIVRIVTDEKFVSMGLPDPPGWEEHKASKIAQAGAKEWEDLEEETLLIKKGKEPARKDQRKEAIEYLEREGMSKEEIRRAVGRTNAQIKKANAAADKEFRPKIPDSYRNLRTHDAVDKEDRDKVRMHAATGEKLAPWQLNMQRRLNRDRTEVDGWSNIGTDSPSSTDAWSDREQSIATSTQKEESRKAFEKNNDDTTMGGSWESALPTSTDRSRVARHTNSFESPRAYGTRAPQSDSPRTNPWNGSPSHQPTRSYEHDRRRDNRTPSEKRSDGVREFGKRSELVRESMKADQSLPPWKAKMISRLAHNDPDSWVKVKKEGSDIPVLMNRRSTGQARGSGGTAWEKRGYQGVKTDRR